MNGATYGCGSSFAIVAANTCPEPGVASLYAHVPFQQDTTFLAIGERTNANGSKAFREAMAADRYDECVEIARAQTRDGAHLLDVCVDYVGRDGVADMREIAGRFATAATLPLVLGQQVQTVADIDVCHVAQRVNLRETDPLR